MLFWLGVTTILFVLTVVLLGRADRWRARNIALMLLGLALIPSVLVILFAMSPVTVNIATFLATASPAIGMMVVFALAKSVANRLNEEVS